MKLTTGSFINGSTTNDDYHVHTNPAVMRLLHEKGQMSTRFLADFYGSLPWTVVPVSSLVSDSQTGIPGITSYAHPTAHPDLPLT